MNTIQKNVALQKTSEMQTVVIHLVVWLLVFAFPLIFESSAETFRWKAYLWHLEMPAAFCCVFYLNYGLFVPRFYMRGRRVRFFLYNALLVAVLLAFQHGWFMPQIRHMAVDGGMTPRVDAPQPPVLSFILRDVVMLGLTIGLGTTIRLSAQWKKAEAARQESELKNLRNQFNPHFLLNTLNNIYALIAFDSEKAQQTVQDLSKLLRYVLYESQQAFVPLGKEVEFIRNYIDLMRIRVSKEVRITIHIQVESDNQTPVAPLLFISLIENAFKHGISPTEPSFIIISIEERDDWVRCEILNSNHPKTSSDKSGSGIGLEQVKKRLELIYPGKYDWDMSLNDSGTVYASLLSIKVK